MGKHTLYQHSKLAQKKMISVHDTSSWSSESGLQWTAKKLKCQCSAPFTGACHIYFKVSYSNNSGRLFKNHHQEFLRNLLKLGKYQMKGNKANLCKRESYWSCNSYFKFCNPSLRINKVIHAHLMEYHTRIGDGKMCFTEGDCALQVPSLSIWGYY